MLTFSRTLLTARQRTRKTRMPAQPYLRAPCSRANATGRRVRTGIRIGTGITPGKTVMTSVTPAYAATSPHRIGLSPFTSHSLQFFAFGLAHEEPNERDRDDCRCCVEPIRETESEVLKGRKRGRHGKIRQPLRRGGHRDGDGPDAVREHLAEQHPHHRTPRETEGDDVEIRRDKCYRSGDGAEMWLPRD